MESIHTYVLRRLNDQKGNWPNLAKASGVPYRTLKKIADGTTKNPRIKVLQRLAEHFESSENVAA